MTDLFLGIDSSTQGCKAVVIKTLSNEIVYLDAVNYDQDLPQYQTHNGVIQTSRKDLSEADPRMWIDALHLIFQKMLQQKFPVHQIKAISVSGQQHGLVCLDAKGNLSRPLSKLWNDTSTIEECQLLTNAVGGAGTMIKEVGNTQRPGYTAGKIYHLYRHEPEAATRSSTFFLVHNFVNYFLTGGIKVMEPGDVSGMALSFPGSTKWSKKVCQTISADLIEKLPPVKPSDEMIGKISPKWVKTYGFSPNCWIDAGSGDNMYGAIGTGNIGPGIVTISLGTSGTAYTIFEKPYVDPAGEIASFCDSTGKYLPLLCVSNLANGYNQLLSLFQISHEDFGKIIESTPPGNEGRIIYPWFIGERTPDLPHALPVYMGFALSDFTKPVLCRAVLEGHVLNLFDGFKRMPVKAREIRLTGGLSKSDAWCQTIADVFEADTVPVEGEGAALGAALHAAWVFFKKSQPDYSLQTLLDKFVKLDEKRRKQPENAKNYQSLKMAYCEMSARLRNPVGNLDPFKMLNQMSN
jgi:xylulokinase